MIDEKHSTECLAHGTAQYTWALIIMIRWGGCLVHFLVVLIGTK